MNRNEEEMKIFISKLHKYPRMKHEILGFFFVALLHFITHPFNFLSILEWKYFMLGPNKNIFLFLYFMQTKQWKDLKI